MIDSKQIRRGAYDAPLNWSTLRRMVGEPAPAVLSGRQLADRFEEATQDVHFVRLEPGAREQAAQTRQQSLRVGGIEKSGRYHGLFEMTVDLFDLFGGGK